MEVMTHITKLQDIRHRKRFWNCVDLEMQPIIGLKHQRGFGGWCICAYSCAFGWRGIVLIAWRGLSRGWNIIFWNFCFLVEGTSGGWELISFKILLIAWIWAWDFLFLVALVSRCSLYPSYVPGLCHLLLLCIF